MAERLPGETEAAREANRMYWDSDASVNAVAEALGVSKGRLYELVAPLPVGIPCPECGTELAFPNRTARDRGLVTCDTCGFEGDREELEWDEGAARDPFLLEGEGGERRWGAGAARGLLPDGVGTPVVVGGLLLGAAAGILLVRWLRD